MQIGGEGIENMFMNMVLEFYFIYKNKFEKIFFHVSLFGNWPTITKCGCNFLVPLE
jgi:hypothetical protein